MKKLLLTSMVAASVFSCKPSVNQSQAGLKSTIENDQSLNISCSQKDGQRFLSFVGDSATISSGAKLSLRASVDGQGKEFQFEKSTRGLSLVASMRANLSDENLEVSFVNTRIDREATEVQTYSLASICSEDTASSSVWTAEELAELGQSISESAQEKFTGKKVCFLGIATKDVCYTVTVASYDPTVYKKDFNDALSPNGVQ